MQALSHLALDALQMGSTLAILWACLRVHRAHPRHDGWFRLALRPPAKWLVVLMNFIMGIHGINRAMTRAATCRNFLWSSK